MTAAEKAMQDIRAELDWFFDDNPHGDLGTIMNIHRIIGRYDMERVGEEAPGNATR